MKIIWRKILLKSNLVELFLQIIVEALFWNLVSGEISFWNKLPSNCLTWVDRSDKKSDLSERFRVIGGDPRLSIQGWGGSGCDACGGGGSGGIGDGGSGGSSGSIELIDMFSNSLALSTLRQTVRCWVQRSHKKGDMSESYWSLMRVKNLQKGRYITSNGRRKHLRSQSHKKTISSIWKLLSHLVRIEGIWRHKTDWRVSIVVCHSDKNIFSVSTICLDLYLASGSQWSIYWALEANGSAQLT